MRVGLDISQLAHHGGVASYTDALAHELEKFSEVDLEFFYTSLRKPYRGDLKNVKQFKIPPSIAEWLFNKGRFLPIEKFIGEVDIWHSSDWWQPPTKAKKITTVHDVIPLKFPEWSVAKIIDVHRRRMEIVEKEIDLVIAVSESTKQDLLQITHIPKQKIVVVPEGVSAQFYRAGEAALRKFRQKYQLPERFILGIGGVGVRRNLERARLSVGGEILLVTGQDIPRVDDDEMPLLYSAASALLYPSLYEGFGLPVIEAMACGTPVITSNVSSLPEVGGDAAFYITPTNITEMADGIVQVMNDLDLRKQMIERGYEQSKKFQWSKVAEQTIACYDRLVK